MTGNYYCLLSAYIIVFWLYFVTCHTEQIRWRQWWWWWWWWWCV